MPVLKYCSPPLARNILNNLAPLYILPIFCGQNHQNWRFILAWGCLLLWRRQSAVKNILTAFGLKPWAAAFHKMKLDILMNGYLIGYIRGAWRGWLGTVLWRPLLMALI